MPTLNYTTTIAAAKTISEIQSMLVAHGAEAVVTNYADRQPIGLSFRLMTPHGIRDFSLPVDIEAVHRLLLQQRRERVLSRDAFTTPEHAARGRVACPEGLARRATRDYRGADGRV